MVPGCDLVHIRSPLLRDEPYAENDFGPNKEQRMPTNHTELTLEQLDTVTGGLVNAAVSGAIAGATRGFPVDQGVLLPGLPCDFLDIFCPVVP